MVFGEIVMISKDLSDILFSGEIIGSSIKRNKINNNFQNLSCFKLRVAFSWTSESGTKLANVSISVNNSTRVLSSRATGIKFGTDGNLH
jgi:hypothetical protein